MASTEENKATIEEPKIKGTSDEEVAVAVESKKGYSSLVSTIDVATMELSLRVLLFASTLTALILMATSKETEVVLVPVLNIPVIRPAKFTHSPALIYFVAATAVASFYSLATIFGTLYRILKPYPTTPLLLLYYIIWEVVILGILTAATGSAGGVAYIGLRGNTHVGWTKVCSTYSKFCKHAGSAVIISLFANVLLVLLIFLSAHSLYRRIR
ncbi:hypothetical protein Sjap_007590 [Stephania japonica]|uniref:CASP-like protein n=1 Tax=Stephania japonica TaxID=461633 RepID=A0AAP0JNU2_9MAGN